jgi:sugar phosphate isomerase/epimerase
LSPSKTSILTRVTSENPNLNPKFAPCTRLLWKSGVLGALEAFARVGFAASEVWAQHLWESGTSAEQVAKHAQELGLRLSLHAPSYDLNPLSSNPEIRAISRRQVLESFETAMKLGARVVVVHPGGLSSSTDAVEEYWVRLEEYTIILNEHAGKLGLMIGIEGMEKKRLQFVTDLPALKRLAGILETNDLTHCGLTLDVAHAATIGDALEFVQNTPRIVHAHLSDSSPSKTHALLGEGLLNLPEIIPTLLQRLEHSPHGLIAIEGRYAADEARAVELASTALAGY